MTFSVTDEDLRMKNLTNISQFYNNRGLSVDQGEQLSLMFQLDALVVFIKLGVRGNTTYSLVPRGSSIKVESALPPTGLIAAVQLFTAQVLCLS